MAICYRNGTRPKSKWNKEDFINALEPNARISAEDVRKASLFCLREIFLKHFETVNNGYRNVGFFSLDKWEINNIKPDEFAVRVKALKSIEDGKKESRKKEKEQRAVCRFLDYPKEYAVNPNIRPQSRQEEGILKGLWFYRKNGTKKKITSKGFEIVEIIED